MQYGLTIRVPKCRMKTINDKLDMLKRTLVYLETPAARARLKEEERREDIKMITTAFRKLLMIKAASPQTEHWPSHSQSASSSGQCKTPLPPSHQDLIEVVVLQGLDEENLYD